MILAPIKLAAENVRINHKRFNSLGKAAIAPAANNNEFPGKKGKIIKPVSMKTIKNKTK